MQRREGAFLQGPTLPFHFQFPLLPSHFCPSVSNIFFDIFFFSSRRKEKKNHREEKNAEKGRSFLSSSYFALSLLAPAFALSLLPFCFKCFLLASFCFQAIFFKKTIEKKKNAKKGGNFTPSSSHSTLLLLAPTSSLLFLSFCFKCFLLGIFSFLSRRIKKKKKKPQRKKKMQRRKGIYLSSLAFAFGLKRSSCFLLSIFLQR